MTMTGLWTTLLGFGMPGGYEWIILLVLGLLIFGRRLPEVGRSLGKGIVEFKRGIKGIEDEIDTESSKSSSGPAELQKSAETPPREFPKAAEPAEPRVSRDDEFAAGGDAEAQEVEASSAGSDPDRTSG